MILRTFTRCRFCDRQTPVAGFDQDWRKFRPVCAECIEELEQTHTPEDARQILLGNKER